MGSTMEDNLQCVAIKALVALARLSGRTERVAGDRSASGIRNGSYRYLLVNRRGCLGQHSARRAILASFSSSMPA